ncbi:non-ribosomal peptide synthetase [Streptomyces heilongjiangensis]|uniref:Non-ribosomal peptide synthetase n=1 Tax=Streptomyces heilongjiangensis TaxID=945052 RepID=A0ABW1B0Y1_9ACTN|nr:non-ribosomal peptide synthetase [Streptomyces heilongjiangensis]MDC2945633.1 amino acid adenylation domain-containing protein [Streptomyces heilongjiangensis]
MNTPSPTGAVPDPRRLAVLRLLFGQVLGRPVAADDDFFAAGGTPAQAGQLAQRMRATLGSDTSEADIRRAPTPSALAVLLGERRERPYTRPETVPLSPAQRGLWFLHRLEGPSATYNLPFALRLTGSLDRAALAAALGDVVRRHETLRTVYTETAGVPRQHVLAADDAMPCLEVTEVAAEELDKALAASARHRFDLCRQAPLRAELFVTGPQEHTLLLVIHHIAADGWSMGPLARDLATAYGARLTGAQPRFAPLRVQYADHTVQKWAAQGTEDDPGSLASQHLAYWREALAGLPEGIDLPADRPRPAVSSFRGDTVPVRIPAAVHDGLTALARDSGTSLFMVLHAALAQLLTRMTGNTDVPLGTVVSGRDGNGSSDDLVGLFTNTVVLRADTSGDPTFRELVARVAAADLAAFAHQDTPFERLVEELAPRRSSSRQPLVNTLLVLQNTPEARLELPGLRAEWEVLPTGAAKFDLTFSLAESRTGQGLTGIVEYSTDLFDRATVTALVDRFITLLESVVAAPDTSVSSAQVLPLRERRLLEEWNATERAVPERTVPELFEERVAEDPGRVALVHDRGEISYGELNERANRLARLLIERGAGPEDLVALALPRSPELYAALLAVAKAGAAYVPLDIEYPPERLAAMLDDARPLVVVTRTGAAPALPAGTPLLDLDDEDVQARLAAAPADNPGDAARVRPLTVSHPLYVIYTSGSTGRPKGVVVEHGGVASLRSSQAEALGAGPGARVMQFASPSFDAAFWEVSLSLLSGGVLVLGPGGRVLPGPELTELAHRQRITHIQLPPSALATLPVPDGLPAGTTVIVGGESCPPETANRWSRHHTLVNGYGPTEATVCTTLSDPLSGPVTPPIGRPLHNTRVHVLDGALRQAPIGVVGELYIAGAGLARGYLGRPALTAERFVADPYGPPGTRMYRTGDLVRRRADGQLEFVSRADHQVKVRGFRVEPGEIEAVLVRHPDVAQAVVILREDRPGDRRLVGYVEHRPGTRITPAALRAHVAAALPDYMVPSAVLCLDTLPLTTNGKVDRSALPAPGPVTAVGGRPPRGRWERTLCALFAEVLGVPEVAADAGFFDLGGDSLLSVRLVERINAELGTTLSVRSVFERQRPEELAALVAGGEGAEDEVDLEAEAVLGPELSTADCPPYDPRRGADPEHVLLTGATGFLGAFLLRALLDGTRATVHCLVRADSDEGAGQRLREAMERFGLWDETAERRVAPLAGDLERPSLGLSAERFEALAELVDVIHHNGARVHLVQGYGLLRPANVDGTREILRLAATRRVKAVHYVSTGSAVMGTGANPELLPEDRRLPASEVMRNGYAATKWVAERLVEQARERGVPVAVYRPGRVSGDSRTGAGGTDDAFWHFVRAGLRLGAVPDPEEPGGFGSAVDLVPVDYVAAAQVALAARAGAVDGAYHLVNRRRTPVSLVWEALRERGHRLRTVPADEWARLLADAAARPDADASVTSVAALTAAASELPDTARLGFDDRAAVAGLAGTGIICPEVTADVIGRCLDHLTRRGFLPATPTR